MDALGYAILNAMSGASPNILPTLTTVMGQNDPASGLMNVTPMTQASGKGGLTANSVGPPVQIGQQGKS